MRATSWGLVKRKKLKLLIDEGYNAKHISEILDISYQATSEGEQPGKSSGDNNPGNAGEKPDVNSSKSSSFMNSKDKHSGSNAGSFMNNKRQEPRSTMPRKSIKNHSKYMDKNSTRGDK